MYKIIFTPYSMEDIDFIQSYIGEYANFVLEKIFHTISHLSYFPLLGKTRDDNLLEIINPKYKFRIIYKLDKHKNIVYIISVFKGKIDY